MNDYFLQHLYQLPGYFVQITILERSVLFYCKKIQNYSQFPIIYYKQSTVGNSFNNSMI